MPDDYRITVEGIAKTVDPLDAFDVMQVRFHVEGERAVFDVPVGISKTLVPADEWVTEARTLLHRIFTDLSEQTKPWASPLDDD